MDRQDRTRWLLCLFALMEGMSQQLLPATFPVFEKSFGMTPSGLSGLSRAMCLSQALFAPVWGMLADRYSRKWLLVSAALGWCATTIALACMSSYWPMLCLYMVLGATLASLTPLAQSIVADITDEFNRGKIFGRIVCFMQTGSIMASLAGTSFGDRDIYGFQGWRVVYGCSALLAATLALWMALDMDQPPRNPRTLAADEEGGGLASALRREYRRIAGLAQVPTFCVICCMGIFGNVPWNAFSFSTTYLQKCGFSDEISAVITSFAILGMALGGLVGGMLGDWAARKSPRHGRAVIGQAACILPVPFIFAFLLGAPSLALTASASVLATLAFLSGLVWPWPGPGVSRPILSEIVPPTDRAAIIAYFTVLEGASAAFFGAPTVGWLAERVFGYVRSDRIPDYTDSRALMLAMLGVMLPLFLVDFFFTTLLHMTYPKDKSRTQFLSIDPESGLISSPVPVISPRTTAATSAASALRGWWLFEKCHRRKFSDLQLYRTNSPRGSPFEGLVLPLLL